MRTVRLAVISDLHFRRHSKDESCRPAAATQGKATDPIEGLLSLIQGGGNQIGFDADRMADYLLCPGDIGDMADAAAFNQGWERLKELQKALGARHLIASTGNHEVSSRASPVDDVAGNVEAEVDPLAAMQSKDDYPSDLLDPDVGRWVYWGRGYEIIETDEMLLVLVNSSHFHPTTRANEFERGRIGEVSLSMLRKELAAKVKANENRVFIMLLHHHPIAHENLDVKLGKIPMSNGPGLMEVLAQTEVAWLVIHGHKHFPRLIYSSDEGAGRSVVFAAGSAGAQLTGDIADKTRLQFYLVEASILDQRVMPRAEGRLRAYSWSGRAWQPSVRMKEGLPDRCGYKVPEVDFGVLGIQIKDALLTSGEKYMMWVELALAVPLLAHILPKDLPTLRKVLDSMEVKSTWEVGDYFPKEFSL